MNANQIESRFAEMGARLKVLEVSRRLSAWSSVRADYAVDIQRDRKGEFFELRVPEHLRDDLEVSVMQSEPQQRHLLLFVRKPGDTPQLDRFFCGHEDRKSTRLNSSHLVSSYAGFCLNKKKDRTKNR